MANKFFLEPVLHATNQMAPVHHLFFPALKGDPVTTGKPILKHIDTVLFGRPGTAMQAFKDQFSDDDLSAVITYERNAWGNNTGDVIQPSDIEAEKNKGAPPPA